MTGLHLHLDMPAGIAGDMTLGALIDLGVPEAAIRAALEALPITGWELSAKKCLRRGMAGTDVTVKIHGARETEHTERAHAHDHHHDHHGSAHPEPVEGHEHRHYSEIRKMLVEAKLGDDVRRIALAIFDRVARAEARLHGTTVADVAFHEVGALDSIVDIVGTAAAVAWLAPASISASPVPLGHGQAKTAHGILPVPAPAALEILREAGAPVHDGGVGAELTTPTGAAIVAALATSFGPMPPCTVRAVGYGAGDMDLKDRPNLVRAVLGEPLARDPGPPDAVVELTANLDDLSPELAAHAAERLFAAGCVDVWFTPVTMKKGRPGVILGALVRAERLPAAQATLFRETSAIGARWHAVERKTLDRRQELVDTAYGPLPVKLATDAGAIVNLAPEFEPCRAAAVKAGVPLKDVYAAAIAACRRKLGVE